ncbi:MAG: AIPR family protein [Gammaproteobacteria bacterium]|nr:AIPR family protein [Gammaproteobacteria bacterium]
MSHYIFDVRYARSILDPVFEHKGIKRHIFVVPIHKIPKNLPTDANARAQNIRTRVAKKIRESLFDKDCEVGTFHLKNNGITIIAEKVQKLRKQEDTYAVEIREGQGIIDGGHTYKIITDALEHRELPETQFVNVEVLVGIETDWIADISGGRNLTVQVSPMSLDNLSRYFDWMQEILEVGGRNLANKIAWRENEEGEIDARDLVALLSLFNIEQYPNDGESHPISAYSRKAKELERFEKDRESYQRMSNIFKDILWLHDKIRQDYYQVWNNQSVGTKAGGLSISQKKTKGKWQFIFTGEEAEYRMVNGALYPILGAFRWFVVKDPQTKQMVWRNDFEEILQTWEDIGVSLLRATIEKSGEVGHRPNAIGKSTTHWRSLHQMVSVHDLMRRASKFS